MNRTKAGMNKLLRALNHKESEIEDDFKGLTR